MTHGPEAQLVKHLEEAHAMERNVHRMLEGMISRAPEGRLKQDLEHHKRETEQHLQRIEQRLEAHGESPSTLKDYGGMMGALVKSALDTVRGEQPARDARDGFATEHLEIASYELLERVADRAGDSETAEVARLNRKDEEAMAEKIAGTWDTVLERSLEATGVSG